MDYKLPTRFVNSNKGTYGRVLNIAGSDYMSGAAYLSSISALKVGCGYCYLCSSDRVIDIVAAKSSNIVFLPYYELDKYLAICDIVEIGCGLSQSESAISLFEQVVTNLSVDIPLLIDADGLNILSNNQKLIFDRNFKSLILTPHPKEASRLLECTVDDVLNDLEQSAKNISKKFNCITVLKTNKTIVCDNSNNIYFNTTGNSALAKAGSGDILAGMISGLIAQKLDTYEVCCLGVYLHGLCGDIAKNKFTEYSVLAEDLINCIPEAIKVYNN